MSPSAGRAAAPATTPATARDRRTFAALLLVVAAVFVWSAIAPRDRLTWLLEVAPVLVGVPLVAGLYPRFRFTTPVYALMAAHAVILMVGGHYTYAHVPPFDWLRDALALSRNHYDRLGHFVQGFVPALILRELVLRTSTLRRGAWLFVLVVGTCLGFSALYELIEWWVAALSGEEATAFLATQGDPWDTQKDMALALTGAVAALLLLGRAHDAALRRLTGG